MNKLQIYLFYIIIFTASALQLNAMEASVEEEITLIIEPVGNGGVKITSRNPVNNPKLGEILDKIGTHPLENLNNCKELAQRYEIEPESYAELMNNNPIFLLDECSGGCKFDRHAQTEQCPRSQAIKIINDHVIPNLLNKDNLTVLSYASGGLYFDLGILNDLHDKQVTIKKFIVIEPAYTPIILLAHCGLFDTPFAPSNIEDITHHLELDFSQKKYLHKILRRVHQFYLALALLNPGAEFFLFANASEFLPIDICNTCPNTDLGYAFDYRLPRVPNEFYFHEFGYLINNKITDNGIFIDFAADAQRDLGKTTFFAIITKKLETGEQQHERIDYLQVIDE